MVIEQKAGEVMGKFVEKYVRIPLREVNASSQNLLPIQLSSTASEISIQIGTERLLISRSGTTVNDEIGLTDETDTF